MGLLGFLGDCVSGICSAVGSACSAVGSALAGGLSMIADGLTGIASVIGDGIKSICEALGSEGLALVGCIAMSILIPGFGLPEILTLIQIIGEIAKILGVNEGEDSPEELGMKAEIAEKKPEDFDSIEQYIKYLNEEIELEKGSVEKLSELEKAKYGALGAGLNVKLIEEKYDIALSPDFLRDVTMMKLTGEEIAQFISTFKENGMTKMQDMTDYLRDKPIETEKSSVSNSMIDAMAELYPTLSKEELYVKLYEMKDELKTE